MQVNLTIELCAGKQTVEESPQRWTGKESQNKTQIKFLIDNDKPADKKPKKFFGGTVEAA
jgi:hypothetical protein